MKTPLKITYRNIASSPALSARIRKKVEELERFHPRMIGCHVLVEEPHRRHHKGRLYHVRIEVHVPTETIVVSRDPELAHEHEDVYVALRDAFEAAVRRLEDLARRRRGEVKQHAAAP
jgi:ribosomal subunit interface protein